jgi:structural maintenance of chromosome 2
MSPMEILGLIAETAGTKMYESKKDAAVKTIEKKQAKVEEINQILAEDIVPSLEKLKKERAEYRKWSQSTQSVEVLQRFCTAYQFHQAQTKVEKSEVTAHSSAIKLRNLPL